MLSIGTNLIQAALFLLLFGTQSFDIPNPSEAIQQEQQEQVIIEDSNGNKLYTILQDINSSKVYTFTNLHPNVLVLPNIEDETFALEEYLKRSGYERTHYEWGNWLNGPRAVYADYKKGNTKALEKCALEKKYFNQIESAPMEIHEELKCKTIPLPTIKIDEELK